MPDQPTQYVWHKLCAEKGEGERFKVADEYHDRYIISMGGYCYSFLKSEYIPCPPPERWEGVPIETRLAVREWGRSVITHGAKNAAFCEDNERFRIIDGALVLERRIS